MKIDGNNENEDIIDEDNHLVDLPKILKIIEDMEDFRKIYLFGEINSQSVLNVIFLINLFEKKDPNLDIEIIINSTGGYVTDTFALIDVMDACSCDIRTTVIGQAASAACLITSNGTIGKRLAGKNSLLMYHEAASFLPEVKYSQLPYYNKMLAQTQKAANKILSRNTGKSIEDIRKQFLNRKNDRYMLAKEARDFGIVDKILRNKRR